MATATRGNRQVASWHVSPATTVIATFELDSIRQLLLRGILGQSGNIAYYQLDMLNSQTEQLHCLGTAASLHKAKALFANKLLTL